MVEGLKFQVAHQELLAHFDGAIERLERDYKERAVLAQTSVFYEVRDKSHKESIVLAKKIASIKFLREHVIAANYILTLEQLQQLGIVCD